MKKFFKKGGAGIILKKENYTYDSAFTEFLENSTWSILNNSTMTSMVLVCRALDGYDVPFASSRADSFLEPIKSIVIKLMVCSNHKKDFLLNLPVELRSRGNKGTGRYSSKILISSESSVTKEASIQNDICFKSSIDNKTLLNGLSPCILGIKKLKYDDVFLDHIEDKNYIEEWSNIANFYYNESDIDKNTNEEASFFVPIKQISELENKMKTNINKNLIKFIDSRYEEEFVNFLYILNFAKFKFPGDDISLCILGMEFINDFEPFAKFLQTAKDTAKFNAIETIKLKNEYEYGISQINKTSNMQEYNMTSSDYENDIVNNEKFNETLYNIYYQNSLNKQLTDLPKCILWSMVSLHSLGYIHGDFHRNNVYVKIKDNEVLRDTNSRYLNDVIIIDFGKTRKLKPSHQNIIDNNVIKDYEPLLEPITNKKKISLINKYPFFSQFIISHISLEYKITNVNSNFLIYFDLLIDLINYYESIGLKNNTNQPSEAIDGMMMVNFLNPPEGKNNQLSVIDVSSEQRNEFSEFVNKIVENYKNNKPSFYSFKENEEINDSIEYDADESVEMSISNSQSGGKTTIFQKENLISSLPNTKVKNTPTKSLTKNKSKFDVDLLIKQFEERHLQREFQDKNYKIPVWNISKSSLSSKYRKTRKNSKSKSKTKNKSLKGGKSKK